MNQEYYEVIFPNQAAVLQYMESVASENGARIGKQLCHDTSYRRGSSRIIKRCRNINCKLTFWAKMLADKTYVLMRDKYILRHYCVDPTSGLESICINQGKSSTVIFNTHSFINKFLTLLYIVARCA
jgi:hypothetical protein